MDPADGEERPSEADTGTEAANGGTWLVKEKVGVLIAVLVASVVLWLILSFTAAGGDVDKGMELARKLLGLAATFAGFLGVSSTVMLTESWTSDTAFQAGGGLATILAGATLLNPGDWGAPAALGIMAAGPMVAAAWKRL